jgi:hypothetical protein
MGLRVAVANGNWSSTATWNGGVLPAAGDIVASNGFTVTIDQNVNVDSITNAVAAVTPTTPQMTSDTTPSGIVTYSSLYAGGSYQGWYAFDRSGSSYYLTANFSVLPQWLGYEFTSSKIITSYIISSPNIPSAFPKDWTFEAWNGTTWIVLHTVVGNTNTSSYTGAFVNTTAYSKYRIYITANNGNVAYASIGEFSLFIGTDSLVPSVAGGTFNLNSGVTVTCTSANYLGGTNTTLLTYSGSGTSTVYGNFIAGTVNPAFLFSGTGTLNLIGNVLVTDSSDNIATIIHSNTGILNFTGTATSNARSGSSGILVIGTGTLNCTGNLYSGTSNTGSAAIRITGISTINITGDIIWQSTSPGFATPIVYIFANAIVNIIGSVYGRFNNGVGSIANSYLKIIGPLIADSVRNGSYAAVSSTGSGAINIFTGPFISGPSGYQPIYVSRMHYLRTMGSYFEFRDNSTNGALPPAGSAPATRLVSPDTVADSPIPANVRQGRSYSLGSQTGTMIVPNPANVVKNVPVDNTVGTGVLDPSALWNVPLSAINTTGSIGQRVKNASTVESTGAQIQTTLNNNP